MKVKLEKLVECQNALKTLTAIKLPLLVSYRIGKASKQIIDVLQDYYKARNEKIMEMGEQIKDKDGKPIDGAYDIIDQEKKKEFLEAEKALFQEEVELNVGETSISELKDIELPPEVFQYLDFLFVE